MKRDILDLKVENIAIAMIPDQTANAEGNFWNVYIINLKNVAIQSVLITSKGYGEDENGNRLTTTTLRHFYELIAPNDYCLIEPIEDKVFNLTNEYWVSFSLGGYLYDKKYIFVVGSLEQNHFTEIPILNQKGVMIK